MTMLIAMRELLLINFEEDLDNPGAKTWKHPRFPAATVLVSPAQGYAKTSIRFDFWTLYAVLRDMMTISIGKRTYYVGT